MAATDYLENKILDHVFGKSAYTPATQFVVALYTDFPSEAGTGTEITGGSYARVITTSSDWSTASNGSIHNVNTIIFPTATASWGRVHAIAIFNESNQMLWRGKLAVSKTIENGNVFTVNANDLVISIL
jgi:uncharacterized protein YaiE (UPF0345 family)